MRKGMMVGTGKRGYHNVIGKDPAVHSQSAKGIKQPQKVSAIQPVILTPSVNSPVVSTSLFGNFGRKGKRLEGYSDPAQKMSWVEWEDGTRSGEFTKNLVSPKTFDKIQENINAPRDSFEIYKIKKGEGSFFNAKEVEIPSSDNPEAELKKRFPNHRFMKVGTVTRAKEKLEKDKNPLPEFKKELIFTNRKYTLESIHDINTMTRPSELEWQKNGYRTKIVHIPKQKATLLYISGD